MKNLLLAFGLVISVPSFAQTVLVTPIIYNFGNSIQLQINNTTTENIYCSGTITMNTMRGQFQTEFYSDYIRAGFFSQRLYYVNDLNDRVNFTNHFITCNKAK